MCDCYEEPCKICGKMIPTHLGDFSTDRSELFILCENCMTKELFGATYYVFKYPAVLWLGKDWSNEIDSYKEEYYLFVYLTKNSWKNWGMNHPNVSAPEPVLIFPTIGRKKRNI
jgi:hypothetical protein